MDKQHFYNSAAKFTANKKNPDNNKIGTLKEKTLHAVLKNYFEPDEQKHEIRIGSYVADICDGDRIIEIQTRSFNAMRKKLEFFLVDRKVTVVYPISEIKWLIWMDMTTGETTSKRKSPKKGQPCEIFTELYSIKQLLLNPNLSFCVVMLETEELRYLNGWSRDKKKGSSRCDRIPCDIKNEIYVCGMQDYLKLLPEGLPPEFTSKGFKKCCCLSLSASQTALNVLTYIGVVKRTGKLGNAYIYEINKIFSAQTEN